MVNTYRHVLGLDIDRCARCRHVHARGDGKPFGPICGLCAAKEIMETAPRRVPWRTARAASEFLTVNTLAEIAEQMACTKAQAEGLRRRVNNMMGHHNALAG